MQENRTITSEQPGEISFEGIGVSSLDSAFLFSVCSEMIASDSRSFYDIQPIEIAVNKATFNRVKSIRDSATVNIEQNENSLQLKCSCGKSIKSLCTHQAQVLFNIMNRDELRVFFDKDLRSQKLKEYANQVGISSNENPELFFQVDYLQGKLNIVSIQKELLIIDSISQNHINKKLLIEQETNKFEDKVTQLILVFRKHRFYDHFCIELCEAGTTVQGKLKKPITAINPFDVLWKYSQPDELKFFSAIARLSNLYAEDRNVNDLKALQAIFKNPLQIPAYILTGDSAENPPLASYDLVKMQELDAQIHLFVDQQTSLFRMNGTMQIEGNAIPFDEIRMAFGYFFRYRESLYFCPDLQIISLFDFFRQRQFIILIPASTFEVFRVKTLSPLEEKVQINYAHLKPASQQQRIESGLDEIPEKLLYLSQAGNDIQLIPAMRYGPVEVSVMSQKQIYTYDSKGNAITIVRDDDSENDLLATIIRLIPELNDQLISGRFFVSKTAFLDEDWFPDIFETLQNKQIRVLGFSELSKLHLSMHKAKVNVQVTSGLDWFETALDVRFGKQKVRMKQLSSAVRNKSKYIQLDDGTQGILPREWLDRFARYFSMGIVASEILRTPKIRFQEVSDVYDWTHFDVHTQSQIQTYADKLQSFQAIEEIDLPKGLNAELRAYQKQGFYWLNFLHEFGFGGCLADDMGLGKTIQVITFLQHLKEKGTASAHLIVVPSTLIFNWQEEFSRFAPELNIEVIYGANRSKLSENQKNADVFITSYGVLQSDISEFKAYPFQVIVLDESQAIKNPETQRYRAVCSLKAKQRLVLTGTPLENNTFDLFGQLSFACPGLLGTKQQFKLLFSIPIDTFRDSSRAKELSRIVKPFILRRTKNQVARELPQRTEMVVYCEMGEEQRRIYEAYSKELRDFIADKQTDEINRNSIYVLQGLTRLRQICNAPSLLNDKNYFSAESSKINALMEQIQQHAPEHKILVFSLFVGMLELIRNALLKHQISHEFLSGQTRNRKERVKAFKEQDEIRVFLISLKAGGTGLNLTEADYVYLVDPWWNPAVENQAIDRAHRIGQKNRVMAVRLICPDTIEDKIRLLQESKQQLISELIPTEAGLLQNLSRTDLLSLLAPLR